MRRPSAYGRNPDAALHLRRAYRRKSDRSARRRGRRPYRDGAPSRRRVVCRGTCASGAGRSHVFSGKDRTLPILSGDTALALRRFVSSLLQKTVQYGIISVTDLLCVSLSWVVLGVFGAVPFVITGEFRFISMRCLRSFPVSQRQEPAF